LESLPQDHFHRRRSLRQAMAPMPKIAEAEYPEVAASLAPYSGLNEKDTFNL
jgi:hypothetical protein